MTLHSRAVRAALARHTFVGETIRIARRAARDLRRAILRISRAPQQIAAIFQISKSRPDVTGKRRPLVCHVHRHERCTIHAVRGKRGWNPIRQPLGANAIQPVAGTEHELRVRGRPAVTVCVSGSWMAMHISEFARRQAAEIRSIDAKLDALPAPRRRLIQTRDGLRELGAGARRLQVSLGQAHIQIARRRTLLALIGLKRAAQAPARQIAGIAGGGAADVMRQITARESHQSQALIIARARLRSNRRPPDKSGWFPPPGSATYFQEPRRHSILCLRLRTD